MASCVLRVGTADALDDDSLRGDAKFEGNVESCRRGDKDYHVLGDVGLEPVLGNLHLVSSRLERGNAERTTRIGSSCARIVVGEIGRGNLSVSDGFVFRVLDRTTEAANVLAPSGNRRERNQAESKHKCAEKTERHTTHISLRSCKDDLPRIECSVTHPWKTLPLAWRDVRHVTP